LIQNGTIKNESEFDGYLKTNHEMLITNLINTSQSHPQVTDPNHHRTEAGELFWNYQFFSN